MFTQMTLATLCIAGLYYIMCINECQIELHYVHCFLYCSICISVDSMEDLSCTELGNKKKNIYIYIYLKETF